jgi:hypothetical protein
VKQIVATAALLISIVAAQAQQAPQPDLSEKQRATAQIGMAIGMGLSCGKSIDQAAIDSYVVAQFGDERFSGREMVAAAAASVAGYLALTKNAKPSAPFDPHAMMCAIALGAYGPDGQVIKGLIKP